MNALVPGGANALVPQTFDDAVRLAKAMSTAGVVPAHLQNDVGSCLLIVEQAMRWRMSPFAVAQCTATINGKLMHEGKLIAAAVKSMGAITGNFDYTWSGEGDERTITASATRTGETQPKTVVVRLADVKTNNKQWDKQPDQQLAYSAARIWARRWTPEALLGVYAPEEFDRKTGQPLEGSDFDGVTLEAKAEPSPPPANVTVNTETDRERVNREVPLTDAPKPTTDGTPPNMPEWKDFCKSLETALRACNTPEAVSKVVANPRTQYAMKAYKGKAKAELDGIIAEATGRFRFMDKPEGTVTPPDDGWPGPDVPASKLPEVEIVGEAKVFAG